MSKSATLNEAKFAGYDEVNDNFQLSTVYALTFIVVNEARKKKQKFRKQSKLTKLSKCRKDDYGTRKRKIGALNALVFLSLMYLIYLMEAFRVLSSFQILK